MRPPARLPRGAPDLAKARETRLASLIAIAATRHAEAAGDFAIEASKGELGVYMKSNGGPKPERVHFRGPSFVNLSALPVMSEGEMVADVVAIIGSLDIVLGEIDR